MDNKDIRRNIRASTEALTIGGRYFLSSFYEKRGAWIRVIAKSTKTNGAGWPSSVTYEVIEPVSDRDNSFHENYYVPGKQGICNATNLYKVREHASHYHKYPHLRKYNKRATTQPR